MLWRCSSPKEATAKKKKKGRNKVHDALTQLVSPPNQLVARAQRKLGPLDDPMGAKLEHRTIRWLQWLLVMRRPPDDPMVKFFLSVGSIVEENAWTVEASDDPMHWVVDRHSNHIYFEKFQRGFGRNPSAPDDPIHHQTKHRMNRWVQRMSRWNESVKVLGAGRLTASCTGCFDA